jgi:hypothetical protein
MLPGRWTSSFRGLAHGHSCLMLMPAFLLVTTQNADLNSRAVWGKYCLRSLECWDCRFESCSGHGWVSAFLCVVLSCVGRGLASGRSPVQGVLPIVYRFTSKTPSTPQGKRGRLRKKETEHCHSIRSRIDNSDKIIISIRLHYSKYLLSMQMYSSNDTAAASLILPFPYAVAVWKHVYDPPPFLLGIFLFTTEFRTAPGPTQPPIQWVSGALSLELKRPGREANHSPPSSTEVKNEWSYTSTPPYVFMGWCLVKHRDSFTFAFFPHLWTGAKWWGKWSFRAGFLKEK